MSTPRWLAAGYLVTFMLGAVAGGAFIAARHTRHQTALLGPGGHGSYAALLTRRLKLSAPQQSEVDSIVTRYEADRHRLLDPIDPSLQALRASMRKEVREKLEPSQQAEFDALSRDFDETRARRTGSKPTASLSESSNGPADPATVQR